MISDVPILVLANKTDRRDAVGEEMIVGHLGVSCRTSKVSHFSYKLFCLDLSAAVAKITYISDNKL